MFRTLVIVGFGTRIPANLLWFYSTHLQLWIIRSVPINSGCDLFTYEVSDFISCCKLLNLSEIFGLIHKLIYTDFIEIRTNTQNIIRFTIIRIFRKQYNWSLSRDLMITLPNLQCNFNPILLLWDGLRIENRWPMFLKSKELLLFHLLIF